MYKESFSDFNSTPLDSAVLNCLSMPRSQTPRILADKKSQFYQSFVLFLALLAYQVPHCITLGLDPVIGLHSREQ